MRKAGTPNRYVRFCCKALKEYYTARYQIIGVRRSESVARMKRYHEPIECRVYNKRQKSQNIMPILEWSKDDILEFIQDRGIKLHPLYYREDGSIDVDRRLGCMCCPLASLKKRREQFKKYPKMLRQYIRNVDIFFKTHPNAKTVTRFGNAYVKLFREIFFDKGQSFEDFRNGLFEIPEDYYKKKLEEYFNVNLDFDETKTE